MVLSKSDGAIIFLDRFTMQEISGDFDPDTGRSRTNTVRTFMDAGFSFEPGEHCEFKAFLRGSVVDCYKVAISFFPPVDVQLQAASTVRISS